METLLTIISLVGNAFNCKKMRVCFIIWIIANVGWTVIDIGRCAYSRALLDIVQIGFSFYGLKEWKKLGRENSL